MSDTPDLDQLRDERVFPVARKVLDDLAETLIPEDPSLGVNHVPLVEKILSHTLDADFNITTECSYLFQVLLGALSGLNGVAQTAQVAPIASARYASIARKILGFVAEANIQLGTVTPEQTAVDFASVQEKLNALFAEENLNIVELKFVMDNIFESFNAVNTLYSAQIEKTTAIAEAKLFGIETMPDLTMRRLDDVLRATIEHTATEAVDTTELHTPGADETPAGPG